MTVPHMTAEQEREWPWKFCGVPISQERFREIELADEEEKKHWKAFYLDISRGQGRSDLTGQRKPW